MLTDEPCLLRQKSDITLLTDEMQITNVISGTGPRFGGATACVTLPPVRPGKSQTWAEKRAI